MPGEPFHRILGVPVSDAEYFDLDLAGNPRPQPTEAEIAEQRRRSAELVSERLRDELLRAAEWAAEYEVETVEVEPEGDYKRFKVTPRMRMVIEWVKPEAAVAG